MMKIESTGQFTIPTDVLEAAGMPAGTEVELFVEPCGIRLAPAQSVNALKRSRQEIEAAVKRFSGSGGALGLTTDEYMKLVRGDWNDEPPGVWEPDVSGRR